MLEVRVYTDRTVHYKRSKMAPIKVVEEWTGKLDIVDYNAFLDEIINTCKMMSLPQKPDEKMMIKDGSFDDMTVIHNSRKHTIGGYGANHYSKYKCVYQSYNKMLFKVQNIVYKVKPGK